MAFPSAVLLADPSVACPACRQAMDAASFCDGCGRSFPFVAGLIDFRLAPDRYLSLDDERAKAEHLAALAEHLNFSKLAQAYYAMTDDVDASRRSRFLAHISRAEARGRALATLLPSTGRVLEVGCGTGGLLAAASRLGVQIEGTDLAARWLILARKRMESRDVQAPIYIANGDRLPWSDGTFAAIVADSVIEHLDDPLPALREWLRVVKPGGRLILWSPNRYSLLTDPHVGLWGLGFLSRSWQQRYVRARKSCDWTLRLAGPGEASRWVREAGWIRAQIDSAKAPSNQFIHRVYNRAKTLPIMRTAIRRFGPIWQLTAEKGDRP